MHIQVVRKAASLLATIRPNHAMPPPLAPEREVLILRCMATLADDAAWQIAELAAAMAAPLKGADPTALVAQAIAIREAAAVGLASHQSALLREGDLAFLQALYGRITAGKTEDQRRRDPQVQVVAKAMKEWSEQQIDDWSKDSQRDIEKDAAKVLLEAVEAKSGPRPALPCQLQQAIRWSISAPPSLPWPLLERAFINFLEADTAQRACQKQSIWGKSDAAKWVERHEQALAYPDLDAESRKSHTAELAKYKKTVAEEQALATYVGTFTPGMPAPASIAAEVATSYASSWQGDAIDEKDLSLFTGQFRIFWKKHSGAYQAIHAEKVASAKKVKNKNQVAGKVSAAVRERTRWICYSQAFVQWAGKREITASLIKLFPKQEGVVDWKGREFLKTLLAAKDKPSLQVDLSETLGRIGWEREPAPNWKSKTSITENTNFPHSRQTNRGVILTEADSMLCYRILFHRVLV